LTRPQTICPLVPQIACGAEVTILVNYLNISVSFNPSLISKEPVNSIYYIWHRNCLLSQEKMSPLEENLFMKLVDDTEGQGELAEEDKDFLKSLEKMAQEVGDEADSID
jgi:hypothetical protein